MLPRFSLCSQLCRTLCGCACSLTSASKVWCFFVFLIKLQFCLFVKHFFPSWVDYIQAAGEASFVFAPHLRLRLGSPLRNGVAAPLAPPLGELSPKVTERGGVSVPQDDHCRLRHTFGAGASGHPGTGVPTGKRESVKHRGRLGLCESVPFFDTSGICCQDFDSVVIW